jgi:DNA-binding transcriptional regulator YiaG
VYNVQAMEQRKKGKQQWSKEQVRALRQHLNFTQARLAQELGTRQQTISEWEKGMYRPRGTSSTLLSIIAERSGFAYQAREKRDESKQ